MGRGGRPRAHLRSRRADIAPLICPAITGEPARSRADRGAPDRPDLHGPAHERRGTAMATISRLCTRPPPAHDHALCSLALLRAKLCSKRSELVNVRGGIPAAET